MIDDEFDDFDIFDYFDVLPQESFENRYRAMLLRVESELEGREPPHAGVSRDCIKLLSLWSRLVWEFESKERREPRLGEAMKAVEAEIVKMQREHTHAELTKRRRLQRNRHEGARLDGQPSPVEVWRFVVEHENRTAVPLGAAAAAAKHFNKSRSRIRDLLGVAERRRGWLENHLAFLSTPQRAADYSLLRAATKRLLRKLPPRS